MDILIYIFSTIWTTKTIDPTTVNPNDFGEKFDGCFYQFYMGINAEWF